MRKTHLTTEQRIYNAFASQEVENLHGIHNYLHGRNNSAEEWSTIWSTADDISWAHAFGRMRGFDQVWWNSVTMYDYSCYESYIELIDKFPRIGGLDPRPVMELAVHTLVNDVVEVADDGMTARAAYITPGVLYDCINDAMQKRGISFWERYGSDFRCENGKWVYIHEQVCPDFGQPLDVANKAAEDYRRIAYPDPNGRPNRPPTGRDDRVRLADPGPLHKMHSVDEPVHDTVPYPMPYATFNNENSYTYNECYG